ncbi:hypothetical protein M8J77_017800 [Diaphorina citri]|nr:hypothetical protein M8J77_017800 [Diaphorina citri]
MRRWLGSKPSQHSTGGRMRNGDDQACLVQEFHGGRKRSCDSTQGRSQTELQERKYKQIQVCTSIPSESLKAEPIHNKGKRGHYSLWKCLAKLPVYYGSKALLRPLEILEQNYYNLVELRKVVL